MNDREKTADQREQIADRRDEIEAERDRVADERERLAAEREASLARSGWGPKGAQGLAGREQARWQRAAAARAREDMARERDEDADARDRAADARDRAADEREERGVRDALADKRDREAGARDRAADHRDRQASRRSRAAEDREAEQDDRENNGQAVLREVDEVQTEAGIQLLVEQADQRDGRAEERDRRSERRDAAAATHPGDVASARADRSDAARDRPEQRRRPRRQRRRSCRPAGGLLADANGRLQVAAASTGAAKFVELVQLQAGEGACVDCYRTGEQVTAERLEEALTRWPQFAPAALDQGYVSVCALPLRLRGELIGALNLFGDRHATTIVDHLPVAQAMADVATIAILQHRLPQERELLTEQLQHALDSRVVIEQAKGVLAGRLGRSPDEVFERLRSRARATNRRLTEVADEVLQGGWIGYLDDEPSH